MKEPFLTSERTGGIAHLVLSSPPRNALNLDALDALAQAIRQLSAAPPEAIIIRGSGRHFSSGADVDELLDLVHRGANAAGRLAEHDLAFEALEQGQAPAVAAISGCCLGVGLELALCCHLRIAAQGAVLSLPEASFGLVPGCGGLVRLSRLCGLSTAVELALSGRTVCAEEALALGLVDRVVFRRDLEEEAVCAAQALAAASSRRSE
jgi:enoyl-CoA hydratase/carnithine racemase